MKAEDLAMEKRKSIYDSNEVMRTIGHQSISIAFDEGVEAVHFVADAHNLNEVPDYLYDAYVLGYIQGKRAERLRRKGKYIQEDK